VSENTTQCRGNYVKIFEQIDAKLCHLKEEVFGIPEFIDLQNLITVPHRLAHGLT
jgi:hypothetical protein